MCLVSYVPTENGYWLTSNRDEDKIRATQCQLPEEYEFDACSLTFPKDPKGGTWIASKDNLECLVLLNGAFEKHQREDSYLKSRGLIFLELFTATDLLFAWDEYNLDQIEPFTLCYISKERELFELVWDGRKKHKTALDTNSAHLWMSCTLYSRDEHGKVKESFMEQFKDTNSYDEIMDFHMKHQYQIVKENQGISTIDTVSLTQISRQSEQLSMQYISF